MIHETLNVNGNITEWLKKSENTLHMMGFENVVNHGLKGEISATYNIFDTITLYLKPTIDGKVELKFEASKPELIELYKSGVQNNYQQTNIPHIPPQQQVNPVHYAPRFEQSQDFSSSNQQAGPSSSNRTIPKQKKGGGCLKVGLIIFGVLVVLVAFFSCMGSGDSSGGKNVTSYGKSEFGIGETANINNIIVTFTSATESYGDGMFATPDDGNVFLICEFYIDNQSDKDISVSSMMCFEAYCDGYSIQQDIVGSTITKSPQLDGSVAAGKKMNGVIVYQVPSSWIEMEINFTPDFWGGKAAKFIAKSN